MSINPEFQDKLSTHIFDQICRTCSAKNNLQQFYDNTNIINMLEICTQLQFSKTDELLPDKICTNCISLLQQSFDFINTCKKTDEACRKCLVDNFQDQTVVHPIVECYIKEEFDNEDTNITHNSDSNSAQSSDQNETFEVVHAIKQKTKIIHKCDVCNKTFTKSSSLIRHRRIHSGEKPFECLVCNKTFNNSSYLTVHQRIHSGEKIYKCQCCNKSFTDKSNLTLHERIHSGIKPYKCEICTKSFTKSNHLKTHEKVHSGEYSFECNICGKTFKLAHHLKDHKFVHTDERLYLCQTCNKNFKDPNALRKHRKTHRN